MQKKKLSFTVDPTSSLKELKDYISARIQKEGGVNWKITRLLIDHLDKTGVVFSGVKVSYELRDGCPECKEAEIFEHIVNRKGE